MGTDNFETEIKLTKKPKRSTMSRVTTANYDQKITTIAGIRQL